MKRPARLGFSPTICGVGVVLGPQLYPPFGTESRYGVAGDGMKAGSTIPNAGERTTVSVPCRGTGFKPSPLRRQGDEDHDDRLDVADGIRQWAELHGFLQPTRY